MSRSGLKFLAVLLSVLIVAVLFAGLDDLPRSVRAQIDSERVALTSAQKDLNTTAAAVAGDLAAEPDLFRTVPASGQWAATLAGQKSVMESAAADMTALAGIEKANRRTDREHAAELLSHERGLRTSAVAAAAGIEREAAHWIDVKRRLPDELRQMESDYKAIHGFDTTPLVAVVQKAETDWPRKKADLDAGEAGLKGEAAQAETLWQKSADTRRAAAANDFAHLDFAAFVAAEDSLHSTAESLPRTAGQIQALAGQLYNSWDKLLVDMRSRGGGYEQQIRTVTTHYPDATAKNGDTTSDERWVTVPQATYRAMQNDLGMAVEHKNPGLYDSEAERVAQPAGFAYMAPPGQTNQYGYWDHRDGRDFWVFYGQYALMRDLLFNHSYRPLERYDWDGYYESRRIGHTYYGHDAATGAPRYGSQGTATQERYSGSSYAKGGGFKGSQYSSKPGGYRSSPYASPGARQPGGDNSPRQFGSGGKPGEPHAAPPHSGFKPAPSRPSPPSRPSAPRHFGKH
ncbi:MAG TPA: hypothetical protein VKF41_08890 [Bryobacteraceae bacterium]|nr:hypothetical protein [Bryobacteraceae bacterium]